VRKRHLAASAALIISMTALSQTPAFADASVPGTPTDLSTTPTPMTVAGAAQSCGTGTVFASYQNIDGGQYVALSAKINAGDGSAPVSNTTCGAVTHEYAAEGTYPVTLTITDQYGNQQSKTENFDTMVSKGELFGETLAGLPNGSSQVLEVSAI
jgi:PKD domain